MTSRAAQYYLMGRRLESTDLRATNVELEEI